MLVKISLAGNEDPFLPHNEVVIPIREGKSSNKAVKIGTPFEIKDQVEVGADGKEKVLPESIVFARLTEFLYGSLLKVEQVEQKSK
jgi:hypothetical protein